MSDPDERHEDFAENYPERFYCDACDAEIELDELPDAGGDLTLLCAGCVRVLVDP